MLMICQAESLTGIRDPILAGMEFLRKGICTEWVVVKMGSKGSILITKSSISFAPAFKVSLYYQSFEIYPGKVFNKITITRFLWMWCIFLTISFLHDRSKWSDFVTIYKTLRR